MMFFSPIAIASVLACAQGTVLPLQDAPAPAPGHDQERRPAETTTSVDEAVAQGVQFLLSSQEEYEPDRPVGMIRPSRLRDWQAKELERLEALRGRGNAGEWPYEGVYRVQGGVIPSGYRVGGTSIAAEAIMRATKGEFDERTRAALDRALAFVLLTNQTDGTMAIGPKEGYDVRGWGHAYALQFMLLAKERGLVEGVVLNAVVDDAIVQMIDRLKANTTEMGGWNYARDSSVSPFMTGATLLILYEAKKAGFEVDEDMIEEALDALEKARTDEVSYIYAGAAQGRVEMPGSAARSAVAELARYKAGKSDIDELRKAVDGFFIGWDDLLDRKSKQGTHEGEYEIAPYYFFFGHTYAALAIEELPAKEAESRRAELVELIWKTREEDGSWNDRIFPRTASYSTAMAMLALLAPKREPYATW